MAKARAQRSGDLARCSINHHTLRQISSQSIAMRREEPMNEMRRMIRMDSLRRLYVSLLTATNEEERRIAKNVGEVYGGELSAVDRKTAKGWERQRRAARPAQA